MTIRRDDEWRGKAHRDARNDPRIGQVVRTLDDTLEAGDLVILGLANDLGVRENGGRPGAVEGPRALRRALGKLHASVLGGRRLFDAGDLELEMLDGYQAFFDDAARILHDVFTRGAHAIVIGGGHDCAFGTYLGVKSVHPTPHVVNVDAHLDVRPTHAPSSGNPFYRMLEDGLTALTEVGLLRDVNAPEHVEYARQHGATLSFCDPPSTEADQIACARQAFANADGHALQLSIDLDAIEFGSAPGVSWVNPAGLSASCVRRIVYDAGFAGARALDLMELAPALDQGTANGRDGATARLAAVIACDFIAGLQARSPK